MGATMTVGPKGQVVIPAALRKELGLEPGQRVNVSARDGGIFLRPVPRDLIAHLTGCLRDGPSLTEALLRDRAEEVEHDERVRI